MKLYNKVQIIDKVCYDAPRHKSKDMLSVIFLVFHLKKAGILDSNYEYIS